MRRPARNLKGANANAPSQNHAPIPSAGPPHVLGNHPILTWIGELIGSVVRRLIR